MAEDIKKVFGEKDTLSTFVDKWAVIDDCPIVVWCRERGKGSVGDHLPQFVRMAKRDPQIARIAHFHISHLMDEHMRQTMVDVVATEPVQSARMWLTDATLSETQADALYNVFMDENKGAGAYRDAVLSGDLLPVERGAVLNTGSIMEVSNGD